MKFRGKMTDSQCMREFSSLYLQVCPRKHTIYTLSKLGKLAVICLTPRNLSFAIFDENAPRRLLAECTLEQSRFFSEYDVFGISEQHNQIRLQFPPGNLLAKATSALKSPQTSRSIKIKLTKKKTPCLTCEIVMPTHLKHSRVCTHDIPVEIIPRKDWLEFQLPDLPPIDLSIQMPPLKRFKTICDRMKFLSPQLILEANPGGILALKTETDLASVATYFTNLRVDKSPEGSDPDQVFDVRVDFKKIIGFLSIEQVNPNNVICNIINKKLIFMDVIHDNVALHYVIPGILK